MLYHWVPDFLGANQSRWIWVASRVLTVYGFPLVRLKSWSPEEDTWLGWGYQPAAGLRATLDVGISKPLVPPPSLPSIPEEGSGRPRHQAAPTTKY